MLNATILVPWRLVWLKPRVAIREALEQPSPLLWLAPMASGIVQSMGRAASSNVGMRGVGLVTLLGLACVVGTIWGLLQLHLLAGLLWITARSPTGGRIAFRRLRTAIALGYTPLGVALFGWIGLSLTLGPELFADPTVVAIRYGAGAALSVSALYFGTMACAIWSVILQVLAVAEVRGASVLSAAGSLLLAVLLGLVIVVGVVVAVLLMLRR